MSEIKIDKTWSIKPFTQGFEVRETVEYENSDGELDTRDEKTFHRTIGQALRKIRNEKAKDCETVDELLDVLSESYSLEEEKLESVLDERSDLDPYAEERVTNA